MERSRHANALFAERQRGGRVSEDREQERTGERGSATRPVTAAARRERRASARPAAPTDRGGRAATTAKGGATEAKAEAATTTTPKKGRPTPSRTRREKGPSPVKRLIRFLREVVAELRKVIWPTQRQLVTYTTVVLIFVSFMVALVAGLDIAFAKGVFWLFGG
jgi:preprotein translocase subunit SecE